MIVLQIHIKGVFAIKLECDAPVTGNRHRIAILAITFQLMKLVTWKLHVVWFDAAIQAVKQPLDSGAEFRRNAAMVSIGEKLSQPLVPN